VWSRTVLRLRPRHAAGQWPMRTLSHQAYCQQCRSASACIFNACRTATVIESASFWRQNAALGNSMAQAWFFSRLWHGCVIAVGGPERIEQRLGLLEVHRVKPLGEPAVERCQELSGPIPLALLLPQATEAHGSPQLQ